MSKAAVTALIAALLANSIVSTLTIGLYGSYGGYGNYAASYPPSGFGYARYNAANFPGLGCGCGGRSTYGGGLHYGYSNPLLLKPMIKKSLIPNKLFLKKNIYSTKMISM